jgi:AraC family transcriptional regulator
MMVEDRELLVDASTGKSRVAVPYEPVVSSSSMSWEGFRLEHHRVPEIVANDVYHLNHVVVVMLNAPAKVEVRFPGQTHTKEIRPNQVSLIPAHALLSARCSQRHEFAMVSIEPRFLARAAHELGGLDQLELTPTIAADDCLLASLVISLDREATAGCPQGTAYAESLASMMAVHLASKYSTTKPRIRESNAGLTRRQLSQVLDHIHANFAKEVPLTTLASVSGLSAYHFARLFKQSTGLAPHQYLIRVRIERARGLLLHSNESITSIATQVGFCDQSHFSTHFKRIYGVTPRAFIQQIARR